jgi:SAM-dependent methyltransferase
MPRHRRTPTQRYHDRIAPKYEAIYDDAYWQWHDALTWEYLKKHLPSDLRSAVADLGCGSGKWGRKLLKSGYHVTFLDVSAKMVDAARKQVIAEAEQSRSVFLQADLMDLSALPQNHFTLAVALGEPIGCTSDPMRATREIAKSLAPGGLLVATFDNRIACANHFIEKGDAEELEKFLRTGKTTWLTRDPSEQFEIITFEPQGLNKMFAAAGFEVIETIGKTVLPMRKYRELLEDPAARRRWADIEKKLARDPANLARCAHLQLTARKL